LAELENFKVWSGRPEPAVVSGTGDGTDIDTRTRIGAEALLLALGRLSQLPEPPLVFFYATYPPPRFFTKYHRNNMREWAKFWSDYDAPKVKAYLKILHGHADNYEVVATYYNATFAALQRALWPDALDTARATKLWVSDTSEGDWDHHPGRDAHRVVADSIFNAFQRLVDDADGAPRPTLRPNATLASREVLDAVGFCQHMTATISADVECAKSGYAPLGWDCYRDVPTKPRGWIWDGGARRRNGTERRRLAPKRRAPPKRPAKRAPPKKRPPPRAPAAAAARRDDELSFVVPCGRDRRVGVEFLKSYDRMGAVELTIASHDGMHSSKKSGVLYRSDAQREKIIRAAPTKTRSYAINASWPQRESLAHVEMFAYDACFNKGDFESPLVITLRPLDPAKKFKLLSLWTC